MEPRMYCTVLKMVRTQGCTWLTMFWEYLRFEFYRVLSKMTAQSIIETWFIFSMVVLFTKFHLYFIMVIVRCEWFNPYKTAQDLECDTCPVCPNPFDYKNGNFLVEPVTNWENEALYTEWLNGNEVNVEKESMKLNSKLTSAYEMCVQSEEHFFLSSTVAVIITVMLIHICAQFLKPQMCMYSTVL